MSLSFSDEPLLITGFAFCGSSHLARLLSCLDVFVPTSQSEPWRFGRALNAAICPPHDDPVALRDWRREPRGEPVDKLRVTQELVMAGYRGGLWCVRDHLLCLAAPAWCEAYPNARILMLHRDPVQIMAALHARLSAPGASAADTAADINRWSQLLEVYLRQIRRFSLLPHMMLEIRFEDLMASPFHTAKLAARFAGVTADDTEMLDALAVCRPDPERQRQTRPILERWRSSRFLANPDLRGLHQLRAELGYA